MFIITTHFDGCTQFWTGRSWSEDRQDAKTWKTFRACQRIAHRLQFRSIADVNVITL